MLGCLCDIMGPFYWSFRIDVGLFFFFFFFFDSVTWRWAIIKLLVVLRRGWIIVVVKRGVTLFRGTVESFTNFDTRQASFVRQEKGAICTRREGFTSRVRTIEALPSSLMDPAMATRHAVYTLVGFSLPECPHTRFSKSWRTFLRPSRRLFARASLLSS